MTRRLISSATLWNLHLAQGRAEEICAWLVANGLDPDDVSANYDLIVEDVEGVLSIRCTVYLRALDGSKSVHGPLGGTAVAGRRVPLVVGIPEGWPVWALNEDGEIGA